METTQEEINTMKSGGIYIHIPFCRHKCIYCDFYTGGQRIAQWDNYINAILKEADIRQNEIQFKPSTLYIGGGTPSLIPEKHFEQLIRGLKEIIGNHRYDEFTLEVNPEDVDDAKARLWKDSGVNRISIGVQSLNDNELQKIGRLLDSATTLKALEILKKHFLNISVDVMFGLPGQTLNSYRETLRKLVEFQPRHISAYSLMLEEGTALSLLERQHKIILPEESEWLEMFDHTIEFLDRNGYERYEISNYSLPGFESRHNSLYWSGAPYIGLGAGAHSYDGVNTRRANPNDIKGYQSFYTCEKEISKPFYQEEHLSDNELEEEFIMTRLRTSRGINMDEFHSRFGNEREEELVGKVQKYISCGLIKKNDNTISLSDQGFMIYNSVVSDLI